MGIRTFLSEDAESAPLNTEAHAVEHCAVDSESLGALGSGVGRQLLIRQAPDRLALYTVAERVSDSARASHVGTAGLARLGAATHARRATIEADFIGGDPEAVARLTEKLRGDEDAAGLAILAPHGGRIEVGTDDQAELVHDTLAVNAKPVRAWIARGFNRATGAHTCWHITSSEISERSFPKLRSLLGPGGVNGPFARAIAFHGNDDSEAIIVGGGLPRDRDHTQRRNIVNRVTVRGNGIQIEQPLAVRDETAPREAIARAVAELYVDLI
jgi:phage replication-related protein YjqB (UPF0714/DUF867 family)